MLEINCRGDWPVALTNLGEDRDICMLVCKARSMFNPPEVPTIISDIERAYGTSGGLRKYGSSKASLCPLQGLANLRVTTLRKVQDFPA
jgi:hypothetical protein